MSTLSAAAMRGPIENERDYERPQDVAARAVLEGRCPTARFLLPSGNAPAVSGKTAEASPGASASPFTGQGPQATQVRL